MAGQGVACIDDDIAGQGVVGVARQGARGDACEAGGGGAAMMLAMRQAEEPAMMLAMRRRKPRRALSCAQGGQRNLRQKPAHCRPA